MNDQLQMFAEMTCANTRNATSSPEEASGASLSAKPDGPMSARPGRAPAPAPASPRREKEKQLGIAGQLIAVADLSCRLLQKSHSCQRLDIALRIIPGEFHRPAVAVMNRVLKQLGKDAPNTPTPAPAMAALHALLKRIGEITHLLLNLQEETLTAAGQAALGRCMGQFDTIQRSLFSTGMQGGQPLTQEEDLQLEIMLVCQEVAWRLRNLGRDLSLAQDKLGPDDAMLFQPLSSVLLASLQPEPSVQAGA